MAPEYDKLFEIYKDTRKDLIIARLEGSINEEVSNKYGIYSFPMIVLYKPNDLHGQAVFQGNRVANSMKIWIDSNIPEYTEPKKIENNTVLNNIKNETLPYEVQIANKSVMTDEFEFFGREIDTLNQKIKHLENEMLEIKKNFNSSSINEDIKKDLSKKIKGTIFNTPSFLDILTYFSILLIAIALYLTIKRFVKMKQQNSLPIHSKV